MRVAMPVWVVLVVSGCASVSARKASTVTMPQLPKAASLLATTPASFKAACDDALERTKDAITALKRLPPGDDRRRLELYDEATTSLSNAGARAGLAREVHPDAAFREAAEACEQRLEALSVELSQDRALYDALVAIDPKGLDPVTGHWLAKTLREFRRAGVDRDEATRETVRGLNETLVKLGQSFGRNIRDDVRTVKVPAADLEGLPKDWLDAHPAGADGLVAVTTNPPDYLPVMTYAKRSAVREALWRAYRNRAFPANVEVLRELLARRHELSTLLGYASWADYALETKMAKSAKAAGAFIERGRAATEARAKADMATLLARKQKDVPGATRVEPWEQDFYEDRVKNEQFGLDSQALRPYFEYGRVKQGVMNVTASLFGVRYVRRDDVQTWHGDVETYDLFEGDTLLGRLHLDMHPRDNKYKHAAQFGLSVGRLGKELPEAVLVCNFPRPGGLLQHSEVETFFHEFGHLLHELFAGRQPWGGVSGIRTEWDFVEVPSMLLQEWPLDAAALAAFARHHQTDEVIPPALVKTLKAAKEFGVGLSMRRQFFLSAVSLGYHDRAPGFDTGQVLSELQTRFEPFRREFVEGTHFELGFGHLDGYSAAYYTYQWSTVIAKDLLTRFAAKGLLNPEVATEYRKKVLEPGGSREAASLVQDFLGRPYQFDAFQAWLEGR
ncbi:MAG: M3 family metallopeptidase [Myxococcaceae bacterium]|nr:M3 family metallopeptidase [Myxococcaceae bacterium]